jgi:trehalose synthase
VHEVELKRRSAGALSSVLPDTQATRFEAAAQQAGRRLEGRTVWNLSSTESGGGVAEMLHNLLGYFLDAGVRTRWLIVDAGEPFFALTKRLHNAIHGASGGPFTAADHAEFDEVTARNLAPMTELIRPGDIVMLHDPQTAGLVDGLLEAGARVAWRSHIGRDTPDPASAQAWDFLRGYIERADAFVFSRRQYAPGWLDRGRLWLIPPSIDPLSAKNRPLTPSESMTILAEAGLLVDGRMVVQVSRWDRLKDMPGVMGGFRLANPPGDVHLTLAGPAVDGVTDDPEGAEVYAECVRVRAGMPDGIRDRVHLASIAMDDIERNALIVNALQRRATIVVQKSLAEGFGLTVTEAMWKAKPLIASAVGGIQDQISSEHTGVLLSDPANPAEFAAALRRLLYNDLAQARLGRAGRARVLEHYLDDRQLIQTGDLLESLAAIPEVQPSAGAGASR